MLIGSLKDVEEFSAMDEDRRDRALTAVLDEFRVNPVIDKEIKKNKVIMRELATAVNASFNPEKRLTGDFK